jgi:hypothetical protein
MCGPSVRLLEMQINLERICDTMQFGKILLTFQMNILSPELKTKPSMQQQAACCSS